ncbi:ABC transporter ATP-binding protein [Ketogulonicigenium vulgare]|uniref:Oligopeptide/dipeptide ABC transporter, ATPase subunit n=1 Tax=Ketogulonicigenium vulgare (strain WSH-001) TaxID=759362 RepID=F9Y7X4_KETVW|nr:oligopeptide/dipeptide ABC transporter ATP-binding protein [Ketogulonicigenium vulgare]ADO42913.1 oligopeptide/dipeptide ABC transporter, ATPase subunit [Ketogulonicigenium vulgare Y25]AEM41100.1 Oligopeptide/dipeptide ABC transporter, ATPase subunit [Ketogulonicigenium vulgare WSH-001]ALJ81240.1 peptide ABC transporter ATP-binding protein [Ketogulonicigenium vulgare]ANW33982.1 peptide ABC transporter ATP-binding protein [Ketogulonicigenium vulgare]AOZ54823.1 oligopeptide/dipeptide ABC tran
MSLLEVENLRTAYKVKGKMFYAVDDVSFSVAPNETVGLVGESGCGKSTLGKTIMRLIDPADGKIKLAGTDIAKLPENQLRPMRKKVQMVFQDPFASLNPRQTVWSMLDTPLKVHGVSDAGARARAINEIAETIGFSTAALHRFPHEFSGGQRQRVGIARALILRPDLVVCDEPVSALDLSIQAQILNLLVDLKRDFGLAFLFISHDLSVVRYFSDRVLVMYLGKIVEAADQETLWKTPRHPYTRALLASVPSTDPSKKITTKIAGEIGRGIPEIGCRFRARCPVAVERCGFDAPALRKMADGAEVACHLA